MMHSADLLPEKEKPVLTAAELEAQARSMTYRAIVKAELYLGRELPTPEIDFSLRGKTAGIFQYHTHRRRIDPGSLKLRFNRHFLTQHSQAFITQVVPHEVAHMAVYTHHGTGVRPHGQQWQAVMEQCFGLAARIYHDFPIDNSARHSRPYLYACDCRTHQFTARRHKNRLKGGKYVCQHCGTRLNYIGKSTNILGTTTNISTNMT